MIKATWEDRDRIVHILVSSFDDNKSVNYIVKQGKSRIKNLRALMRYSFDVCYRYGEVYLSGNGNACALVLLPEKKKTSLHASWLDIKLILHSTGLKNVLKAVRRENIVKEIQPAGPLYYLWFIGVEPAEQGKGMGSILLKELIAHGRSEGRTVCLETSTLRNLPWYAKHGFQTYAEKDFAYKLYFLKL